MRIFIIIAACLEVIYCQAPDTAWTKAYDGGGSEECRWIEETSDKGFIMAGVSQISGDTWMDILLIRTDQNGNTLWKHRYGDEIINQDAYCVKEDYDGGFVIAGIKHLTALLRNAWVIKTDSNGDTVWTKKYGGSLNTEALHVSCTVDSGYIITGRKFDPGQFSNAYLLKLNKNGETEWVRTFGGSGYEEGYSVQQTADSGFVLAGSKDMGGSLYDFYLIKTDTGGSLIWSNTYGGNNYDHCTSVKQTSDNGYILFGESDSFIPNSSLAVKTNSTGDTLWTRIYKRSNGDYGWSVDVTDDGGFIFGGYTNNPGYYDDYWFVKTDSNGDTLWMKSIKRGNDQRGYCIIQTSDGGYALAGTSTEASPTFFDFFIVKLNGNVSNIYSDFVNLNKYTLNQNYPNPFNPSTKIRYSIPTPPHPTPYQGEGKREGLSVSLVIYDILGNEIETLLNEVKSPGTYEVTWHASDLASGVYIYKLETKDFTEVKKMLLIR